ncbi:FtsW/RodA/SpoVE family cell cycle protein [Chengkuizengella axinellae]|uniref:FtsW/RodA/SpoVE family cell cycle protein n=1 Tax=Chengkuizengella axinellae TaxID=3064388 RepID=A0ABT9IUH1_9BACL|nr:FtsW/RodA/SpoVE family cell cycle protein [Chengkuizengella sp. 2205SS18-9]MDP5272732.1 FtsW/RodA/SpoVE family cell cycle protein [Chengkuizengella sp. 2205SS18-9]
MLEKLKKLDWAVIFILFCLMVIGTLLINSSNKPAANYDTRHIIFFCLGFAVMIFFSLFDYRVLIKGAYYLYGFGILLLIGLIFFGIKLNGAKSWYDLQFILFQPAELVKIILIIMIAYLLKKRDGEVLTLVDDLIPIGLAVLVPFIIVILQPDLGNAIIYIVIFIGMLWIGNLKYTYVLISILLISIIAFASFYLYQTFHEEIVVFLDENEKGHWSKRIDAILFPEAGGDRYHQDQAIMAIGSGGLLGEGYNQGIVTVPYDYSDSIFAIVGEEFGFIGSSLLLLLYFLLIYRLILIAIQTTDRAGAYIIVGITSMFIFQVFENVGMLIGIMPLTGITLPFISYGGTSLLINMMSIGIVMSIKVHQESPWMYDDEY